MISAMAKSVTSSGITAESQAGSSGRAWALGVVAVWLVLSLVSASQRYADGVQTSSPVSFLVILLWSLVIWA